MAEQPLHRQYDRAPQEYTDVRQYDTLESVVARLRTLTRELRRARLRHDQTQVRMLKMERLMLVHKLVVLQRGGRLAELLQDTAARGKKPHTLMLLSLQAVAPIGV